MKITLSEQQIKDIASHYNTAEHLVTVNLETLNIMYTRTGTVLTIKDVNAAWAEFKTYTNNYDIKIGESRDGNHLDKVIGLSYCKGNNDALNLRFAILYKYFKK